MTEGSIERLPAFLKTLGSHPEVERLAAGAGAGHGEDSASPRRAGRRRRGGAELRAADAN